MYRNRIFRRLALISVPSLMMTILLFGLSCGSGQPGQPAASLVQPAPAPSTGTSPGTQPPLTTPNPVLLVENIQNTPEPVYSPDPASFVPLSDTVVTGLVMPSQPQFQDGGDTYRDWTVKVENFIVNPLPQDSLKVRILEQAGRMPVKGVHLTQGEHLLMFLKAEGDHYIFVGGIMGAKYTIEGDNINYSIMGGSPKESLTAAISRIKTVADTWKNEKLTDQRKSQIADIAVSDPGIKDFLADKEYEIVQAGPSVSKDTLTQIRYNLSLFLPGQNHYDVQLGVIVNVTQNKVDKIQVNPAYTAYSDTAKNQIQQIALTDPAVRGLIGDKGYTISDVTTDSWQDDIGGKTIINIFPEVYISLQPTPSNILHVFVDSKSQKVVKIIDESYLSPSPLESGTSWQDFKLTVSIPKTVYQVGETAQAVLTLSCSGTQAINLSSPNNQYFDLLIKDTQNNIVYQWERWNAGLPPSLPKPTEVIQPVPPFNGRPENAFKETINPGQSITAQLQFSIPKAGTYYLQGRIYGGWDFGEIMATYPNGSGYGLHIEAPFIIIEVR
jgi:hypothetical protein